MKLLMYSGLITLFEDHHVKKCHSLGGTWHLCGVMLQGEELWREILQGEAFIAVTYIFLKKNGQ